MPPSETPPAVVTLPPRRLDGEAETARYAQDIAMAARAGWTIRLEGDLGAGKSTFARAFIRALARDPGLEVPSPTYTLVQRYEECAPPVLHADLYRLADPSEIVELGLDDPDDPAIRLIEWPIRAGEGAFPGALTLHLALHGTVARVATLSGPVAPMAAVASSLLARVLIDEAGFAVADRARLTGDASARRYETVTGAGAPVILMDAPRQPDGPPVKDGKPYSQLVHLAESVDAFVAVSHALRERGFAAPRVLAGNLEAGQLLLEDMGRGSVLDGTGAPVPERYAAAAATLAALHGHDWPTTLPVGWDGDAALVATKTGRGTALWPDDRQHALARYDSTVFLTEISLCPDWYLPYRKARGAHVEAFDREAFFATWAELLAPLDGAPATLVLRDFHSPNIIWREGEEGIGRVGIIDHQDALLGPPAYDVASLVHDARVTIEPTLQDTLLSTYLAARGSAVDPAAFRAALALMQLQRNTKILGIFARLDARDGKPQYLAHLPRIEAYVRQALAHPALAALRPFYAAILPPEAP